MRIYCILLIVVSLSRQLELNLNQAFESLRSQFATSSKKSHNLRSQIVISNLNERIRGNYNYNISYC